MRIAIVSDIHGNRNAFEAVVADLRESAPDLIFHGGDLADSGSSPMEIVDRMRDLGWPGILGNTDEMLVSPESLQEFAKPLPQLKLLFDAIGEMAAATRDILGEERLAWMRSLPRSQTHGCVALVHGSPDTSWRAPAPEASDEELQMTYGSLGKPVAVYGHVHRPYVRKLRQKIVANTGSVGLSYDGDTRASYLLIDDGQPSIRRVPYDVQKEVAALSASKLPHAEWIAKMLITASPLPPSQTESAYRASLGRA